jgi:putative hydrolase of the HAD superfamily
VDPPITALFLDVGGVLLTNGWDQGTRKLAAETFHLDFADMDHRHHLTYDTYEAGKLSLDEYLERVVFHSPRSWPRPWGCAGSSIPTADPRRAI